ncbi:hypothetical protein HN51_043429 [Arachis hypogaea]
MDRTIPTLAPRVHWVHLNVPSSVGTEVTNIHWWGAGLRSPYLTMKGDPFPPLSKMMKMKLMIGQRGCGYYGSSDSQSGCLPRSRRSCL